MLEVRLIPGGLHRDNRGEVRHVNPFSFERVDRFYTVHPARSNEVRGWVGHQRDWKWFFVAKGIIDVGVVEPGNWTEPDRAAAVRTFRLDAETPAVLEVPPGFYTATAARTEGAILTVFSSGDIEDARTDDFRLPADTWKLEAPE